MHMSERSPTCSWDGDNPFGFHRKMMLCIAVWLHAAQSGMHCSSLFRALIIGLELKVELIDMSCMK